MFLYTYIICRIHIYVEYTHSVLTHVHIYCIYRNKFILECSVVHTLVITVILPWYHSKRGRRTIEPCRRIRYSAVDVRVLYCRWLIFLRLIYNHPCLVLFFVEALLNTVPNEIIFIYQCNASTVDLPSNSRLALLQKNTWIFLQWSNHYSRLASASISLQRSTLLCCTII